jgi:hypothetical protein
MVKILFNILKYIFYNKYKMISNDMITDMISNKNYEMKEYLCIILKIPYKYNINKLDCKQHLLFHSISLLEEKFNYKLHIIADTTDIIENVLNIALIYINEKFIDSQKTLYNVLSNKKLEKILYLEPNMIITNHSNIKLSALYINKYHIQNKKPKIPNINPFFKNDNSDSVKLISSYYIADILMNDITNINVLQNLNKLTLACDIKISCLIIVNPKNNDYDLVKSLILRSFELYNNQNHQNKELILVCNTDFKQLITNYFINNDMKNIKIIYDNNDYIVVLKILGCNECNGDYVFKWNLEDWYHPSILSIFADKAKIECLDLYSMSVINCHYNGNFYYSSERFTGWFDIMMIKKDKINIYAENNKADNIMLSILWEKCEKFYIFENDYSSLYVKMNATHDLITFASPLQDYYSHTINKLINNVENKKIENKHVENKQIENLGWSNRIYNYLFS